METERTADLKTWMPKEMETLIPEDFQNWKLRDLETQRYGDLKN